MLIVISPAKSLNFDRIGLPIAPTFPAFINESGEVAKVLKKKSPKALGELMGISENLAGLNHQRYQDWHPEYDDKEGKTAIHAFDGDVYDGLGAMSFNKKGLEFAQAHLRILSGLYGVLRPLDLILPYRLEMGTKIAIGKQKDLYGFWGNKITDFLNLELDEMDIPVLINLASNEYFKSVNSKKINGEIITPIFKNLKGGQYKVVSFFAKKARGMMSRYIIQNEIKKAEDIKSFEDSGYIYNPGLSSGNEWVFTRG